MSIEITSQFNNKAGKPLDVNSVKATIVERDAITDRYIGLKVFVEETLTEYVLKEGITNNDWKEVLELIKENITEQQTLISTDKILIQDTVGSFKWISFANLKRQLGLQVGQKYLGGTIIQLNEDGTSGVIASYFEFENTYEYAMINYSTIGTYVKDGYSNWRLPNITELDLIFQYSKPERDIIGDVNGDGIVNQLDKSIIEQATNLFIDNTHPYWNTKWFKSDINGDGTIDSDDVALIENLINTNQGSMYQYDKYISYSISEITPTTSCKGYIAPVLTMSEGVISQTPHVLTEVSKTDTAGIRLVRNF